MMYLEYYMCGLGCLTMTAALVKYIIKNTDESGLFFTGVFITWVSTWIN